MKPWDRIGKLLLVFLFSSYFLLMELFLTLPGYGNLILFFCLLLFFLWFNLHPRAVPKITPRRLKWMIGGYDLMTAVGFCLLLETLLYLYLLFFRAERSEMLNAMLWANLLLFLPSMLVLMFNGFCRMMLTSAQIGIALRVVVLIFWWVPILNFVLLWRVCHKVRLEFWLETSKLELDGARKELELCQTKYPLVLVHGIFFRDWQLMNYWGRIPKELIRNGATIYYGGQQSAASVADSAAELKENILKIVRESGCGKVNLIAHSKGGLDARYAISALGLGSYVATLTTINTPHRGVVFGEILLEKLPHKVVRWLEDWYNSVFHVLGDKNPDFLAGVTDLTASRCQARNEEWDDDDTVFYQSVMCTMKKAGSAGFPLNFTYRLVKKYDREANDGLVPASSAPWGKFLGTMTTRGKRGLSHGDIIDLTRENIPGFDVREFYVSLVTDLKEQGY